MMCKWGTEKTIHVIRLNNDTPDGWYPMAVDACIAPYVQYMNLAGIITLGCCCGHRREPGTVLVSEQSRELMDEYGYDYTGYTSGYSLLHEIRDLNTELEQRCVNEWRRLNIMYQQAKREHMDAVVLDTLHGMNTIARILRYEPEAQS